MRVFKDNLSTFSHWFAWTMAFVASIFFGIFLISEDIPSLIKGDIPALLWFVIFLIIAITGTVISFWNRFYGGIIMLAGGFGLVLYYYFQTRWMEVNMMFVYGLPYILPGCLLLIVKK